MNSSADHISFGCDIIREGSATKTTFQLDDPDSDTRLAAMESERDASVLTAVRLMREFSRFSPLKVWLV